MRLRSLLPASRQGAAPRAFSPFFRASSRCGTCRRARSGTPPDAPCPSAAPIPSLRGMPEGWVGCPGPLQPDRSEEGGFRSLIANTGKTQGSAGNPWDVGLQHNPDPLKLRACLSPLPFLLFKSNLRTSGQRSGHSHSSWKQESFLERYARADLWRSQLFPILLLFTSSPGEAG